jgi:hypothetical protein
MKKTIFKSVKIGTMPGGSIIFRYRYKFEPGQRVLFRESSPGSKYQTAIVRENSANCIYLELF